MAGLVVLLRAGAAATAAEQPPAPPASYGEPAPLPLPSTMSVPAYEALLFKFLNERQYVALGWIKDKRVRDTGPYIKGTYYGTHPAVRIYYSPEIIAWLVGDKRGAIPDGAMIVKEQFEPPAVRHDGLDDDALFDRLFSWTVMVKDSAGSHDGWFWSNPAKGQEAIDSYAYPFPDAASGFGIYCLRCHASTKTHGATNEYTFASLRNVAGFPGEPLRFNVDDSWRAAASEEAPLPEASAAEAEDTSNEALLAAALAGEQDAVHPRCTLGAQPVMCEPVLNQAFLALYASIGVQERSRIRVLPPVTQDWVVRRPAAGHGTQPFVTSNQCMSCHAGLVAPFGPSMFRPLGATAEYGDEGVHLSPYGEWRWTPMGLAGRDPIFFAQLESEIEMLKEDFAADPAEGERMAGELVETCLTCHGAMGKHQFTIDHGEAARFSVAHVMRASTDPAAAGVDHWQYGALARDGISCAVCHQMEEPPQPAGDDRPYLEYFLENSITGAIHIGAVNEMHGPIEDKELAPYAMEHAMGFTPKHNPFMRTSRMCGTCHVVNLPIMDRPEEPGHEPSQLIAAERNPSFRGYHHHVEQATYLEWLNSEYENEINVENPRAKTCQDCHMKRDYHNDRLDVHWDRLETRIAAIQDNTYPDAENIASHEELEIRRRTEGFARHNFRGLNVFLVEMFNQFDDLLGVRKFDFMTGSTNDISHAIDDFVQQATHDVVEMSVAARRDGGELVATVDVRNLVGHRFPSGVGFRRAFLELLVVAPARGDAPERIVWSSGRTNELGVLVDDAGRPLPCEFFDNEPGTDKQAFQPHHEVITSPGQVQIYETLLWSSKHRFTTSFIHGSEVVKDNRLLPRGWSAEGPGPGLSGEFLRATHPCPTTSQDPRYRDGSGSDEVTYRIALPAGVAAEGLVVRATLYYQAIPPYFLQSLFRTAPNGPATQRLHYICSNIDLRGTPIEDWKLKVGSAEADVR